jgi:hypothetical protein
MNNQPNPTCEAVRLITLGGELKIKKNQNESKTIKKNT